MFLHNINCERVERFYALWEFNVSLFTFPKL